MRLGRLVLLACVLAAFGVPSASAHVEVLPAVATTGGTAFFTVLVPNESDSPTVQVDLKIPKGVAIRSFDEVPGWRRSEQRTAGGAVDVVTWKGRLAVGRSVRFPFRASMPAVAGSIAWPAVQRYADGSVTRWIGPPDSDEPASVTVISASDGATTPPSHASDDGSTNVVVIVAVALGAAGLLAVVATRMRRRRRAS